MAEFVDYRPNFGGAAAILQAAAQVIAQAEMERLERLAEPTLGGGKLEPVHPNHRADLRYVLETLQIVRVALKTAPLREQVEAAINGMAYIIKRTEEAASATPDAREDARGGAVVSAKHTPGPWWPTDYGVRNSGGYIFATKWPCRYAEQEERYAQETAQRRADARLGAAAPELLEALQECKQLLDMVLCVQGGLPPEANGPAAKALAAIAKATGAAS